jgi:hypothetical protein
MRKLAQRANMGWIEKSYSRSQNKKWNNLGRSNTKTPFLVQFSSQRNNSINIKEWSSSTMSVKK